MILARISETAARFPDTTAVQMKADDRYARHTYRDIMARIASAARALSEKGIGKGDRVVLLSENRPEWMIAYLSVVSLGAVIVPLDAQLTDKEVALLICNSEAKAVFVSAATRRNFPPPLRSWFFHSIPARSSLFGDDPGVSQRRHSSRSRSNDLAALLYTSGTTGDPKGVMLSHGNLASNCASCMQAGHRAARRQHAPAPAPAPYLSGHGMHAAASFDGRDRDHPEQPERSGYPGLHGGNEGDDPAGRAAAVCRASPGDLRRDPEKTSSGAADREIPARI